MQLAHRLLIACLFSIACFTTLKAAEPRVETKLFGKLPSGEEVKQFNLYNRNGMQATVIEYGATVTRLLVADRNGKFANILLGADSLEDYTKGFPAASVIGRYANRIRGAKFTLDNETYQVTKNAGDNHIHGGRANFAKVRWTGTAEANADSAFVKLNYRSKHGEEGFPGELNVTVTYRLTNANELSIQYEAKTDKPTIVNLTNHAYFNLSDPSEDVLNHELQIMAQTYTISDRSLIPTGEIASVVGTPLDFLVPHRIGERIEQLYDAAQGYDHNYIVAGKAGELRPAARVVDPKSGRVMECLTTEPGVQLYTANGFNGNPYPKHGGFCLETQHYPDSPNHPEFPTTIIRPETPFSSTTLFRFSVR
jgi:aldose 1-epimerase